jgi:cell shape-determining protein MreD
MFERKEKPEMSWRQRAIVIVVDVLMIAELCVAMYRASLTPDELTPVFMRTFLPMLVPTLIAAFVAIRLARPRQLEEAR